MAEGHLIPGQRLPEHQIPVVPVKKEITSEKLAQYIEQLQSYLRDWEIMPDSFLLVADYQADNLGNRNSYKAGEKNKLRTAWFNVISWMKLISNKTNLRMPELVLDSLTAELQLIKQQEEAVAYWVIADRGIKLTKDPLIEGVVVKRIKKEIAPQFLDRKIALIHKVEASIRLLLEKLNEKLCQVSD